MVRGIDTFTKYFADYPEQYIIIGGTALDIQLDEAGFNPRATKDIDIILVVEAFNSDFVAAFWEFIRQGNYARQERSEGERQYYRFEKPANTDFPYQLELFARNPGLINLHDGTHLTPIPAEDDLSSLSAILMDDDYYRFTLENALLQNSVHLASPVALIILKAKALIDWTARKAEGHAECDKHIKKHKNDLLRLTLLLAPAESIGLPASLQADLQTAANILEQQLPDKAILKAMGVPLQPELVFAQLKHFFKLN